MSGFPRIPSAAGSTDATNPPQLPAEAKKVLVPTEDAGRSSVGLVVSALILGFGGIAFMWPPAAAGGDPTKKLIATGAVFAAGLVVSGIPALLVGKAAGSKRAGGVVFGVGMVAMIALTAMFSEMGLKYAGPYLGRAGVPPAVMSKLAGPERPGAEASAESGAKSQGFSTKGSPVIHVYRKTAEVPSP